MSKQQRHEKRKVERTRRRRPLFRNPQSAIPNGAAALAAAAAIAAGTQAYAEPVRFDNPPHGEAGHFHWPSEAAPHPFLDVTLPAADQPGSAYDSSTVANKLLGGGTYSTFYSYPADGLTLQATGTGSTALALGFNAGDVIPFPTGIYDPYGQIAFAQSGFLHYPGYDYVPEGVPTYLGVQLGGPFAQYYGTAQFGWIGGVRTGGEFDVFAWGYETEIGVPIPAGIPEPGTLALLAFGAAAVTRRRRSA